MQQPVRSQRRDRSSRPVMVLLACFVVGLWSGRSAAVEIVLQHDMMTDATEGTPLLAFLAGEMAATWYTAPLDGTIVGVQVVWGSTFGSSGDSQEYAIHIYDGGTFPNPASATPLDSISGPVLVDGTSSGDVNEFRYLDPSTEMMPLEVSVTAGQDYVVALEFLNENDGQTFAPSVKYDDEDCLSGTSAAYASPDGWGGGCSLGISGNLGIRAILDVDPIPGDYDGDLDVDEDDFEEWRSLFGGTDETSLAADGNGNGIVDAADYAVWRDNLGAGLGAGSGSSSSAQAAVPEPASITLLLFGIGAALLRARRHQPAG